MPSTLSDELMQSTEAIVRQFLTTNSHITNRKLREISTISYDQAIAFFNRMVEEKKLKRTGKASGIKYELPE